MKHFNFFINHENNKEVNNLKPLKYVSLAARLMRGGMKKTIDKFV